MAFSLLGVVDELLHGPVDPDVVVLEADRDVPMLERFAAARAEIESAFGDPQRSLARDQEWFEELAPRAVAGAAWRASGRYLVLLLDAGGDETIGLTLHALAEDDVDEP